MANPDLSVGKSFGEFVSSLARAEKVNKWTLAIVLLLGGLCFASFKEIVSWWASPLCLSLSLLAAAFYAFHKVRSQRDELQEQLKAAERLRGLEERKATALEKLAADNQEILDCSLFVMHDSDGRIEPSLRMNNNGKDIARIMAVRLQMADGSTILHGNIRNRQMRNASTGDGNWPFAIPVGDYATFLFSSPVGHPSNGYRKEHIPLLRTIIGISIETGRGTMTVPEKNWKPELLRVLGNL